MERNLNFEIESSAKLTKMLTGLLMDIRRGDVSTEIVKGIVTVADKINKNNMAAIKYKALTNNTKPIEFFEKK
jgi:hypothetical protein